LAIFLLVTTGRSHYNSHYLNRYKRVSGFFRWAGESIKSIVWPV
jgi:hypothetical protein